MKIYNSIPVLPVWYVLEVYIFILTRTAGTHRVLSLARESFYWPRMKADLEHYVTKAWRCLNKKNNKKTRVPMQSITATTPLKLVSTDFT